MVRAASMAQLRGCPGKPGKPPESRRKAPEGSHLQAALRYVDLNPVRARLAKEATQCEWPSACAHVAGRDGRKKGRRPPTGT